MRLQVEHLLVRGAVTNDKLAIVVRQSWLNLLERKVRLQRIHLSLLAVLIGVCVNEPVILPMECLRLKQTSNDG